jgi:hypothetical protein
MKAKHLLIVGIFALGICLTATPGGAEVVFSLPGGTVIPMPAIEYQGPGPHIFGPDITWTSTNADTNGGSLFGNTYIYAFGANGNWDGGLGPMATVNDSYDIYGVTDTMTFAFATPVGAVGGFLNYAPYDLTPTTIAVYDASHNLIESYNLIFHTDGSTNSGMFIGFQETTANISYFTLTDNFIGITNLTTANPVPLPGAVWLLGSGLVGLAGLSRKFRR